MGLFTWIKKNREKSKSEKNLKKAREYFSSYKIDLAKTYYEKAEIYKLDDIYNYGVIMSIDNNYNSAINNFHKALSLLNSQSENRNYYQNKIYNSLIEPYFQVKRYEDVVSTYQKLNPVDIKDDAKAYESNAVYYYTGKSLENLEQYGIAVETYKQAILTKNKFYEYSDKILIGIGNCLVKQGKKKQAVSYYNKSLALKYNSKLGDYVKKLEE